MKEQCCFETAFKNAEPQEDDFCGCHEDYDFDWNENESVDTIPLDSEAEFPQHTDCGCLEQAAPEGSFVQTDVDILNDASYDIVDI